MPQHSVRRPSGHLITTPLDGGPEIHRDTLSCCHCGRTWVHSPGSGKVRGFCMRCNGPVCGRDCAAACVPVEQMIENLEHGRELDYRPIFSAGGLVLP